jgi:cell division protein FtsQ
MALDKALFSSWWKRRSGKGGSQRGASPRQEDRPHLQQDRSQSGYAAVLALPWRKVAMHLALFSFWLIVLGGGATLLALADRKVGAITVGGDLLNLSVERVQQRLNPFRSMSFFGISLGELRQELLREAWVADAKIHRKWPDGIEIEVVEQRPVVYWVKNGLLNGSGKLFQPEHAWQDGDLPRLSGPQGSHLRVFRQYQQWDSALSKVNLRVAELHLDDRGAWSIGMDDGWKLDLGKNDLDGRFNRFLANYPKIREARKETIERIDMRYSSGMAVRWKPLEEADKPGSPVPKAAG